MIGEEGCEELRFEYCHLEELGPSSTAMGRRDH